MTRLNPIDPLDRWSVATRGFGGPLRLVDSANKTVAREVRSLDTAKLLAAAPAMASAIRAYLDGTQTSESFELRMALAHVLDLADGRA